MVMTDDDLEAVELVVAEVRRLRDEVAGANENVASWQGIAADLRADRDELEASYYVLLSQCHRLEEERNQLRVKRTAMLDAARERTNFLEAEVARLRNERKVIAEKWLDEAFENRRLRDQMGDRRE